MGVKQSQDKNYTKPLENSHEVSKRVEASRHCNDIITEPVNREKAPEPLSQPPKKEFPVEEPWQEVGL